jgi:hypothetical protein
MIRNVKFGSRMDETRRPSAIQQAHHGTRCLGVQIILRLGLGHLLYLRGCAY